MWNLLRLELETQGKTVLFVKLDGKAAALLAASDTLRPEVPQAIREMQALGIRQVELLTGDNRARGGGAGGAVEPGCRGKYGEAPGGDVIRGIAAGG